MYSTKNIKAKTYGAAGICSKLTLTFRAVAGLFKFSFWAGLIDVRRTTFRSDFGTDGAGSWKIIELIRKTIASDNYTNLNIFEIQLRNVS